jgi:hypothetical protein
MEVEIDYGHWAGPEAFLSPLGAAHIRPVVSFAAHVMSLPRKVLLLALTLLSPTWSSFNGQATVSALAAQQQYLLGLGWSSCAALPLSRY